MQLWELLSVLTDCELTIPDGEVTDVVIDARKVRPGSLFVAVTGARHDGHDSAEEALANGALAVVTERKLGLAQELVVPNTRQANAQLCARFFSHPDRDLKLIAVTGTNGKTTTASLIKQALEHLGIPAGLIGTAGIEIKDKRIAAKYTTPEPWDLFSLLSEMKHMGCTHVVLEASSQAIAQQRLFGLQMETSVFTNLSQDHLDYHGTMERYFEAKACLFRQSNKAVLSIDDAYGERLANNLQKPMLRCSIVKNDADYTAKDIQSSLDGVRFLISGDAFIGRIKVGIPGNYTVQNALLAFGALISIGVSKEDAAAALSSIQGVRGRSEVLYQGDFTVIGDFAHTADALRQLLLAFRPHVGGRLITLFGAAGDRDGQKRPDMARAVAELSDYTILTSDNPRTEDPLAIIEEGFMPVFEEKNAPYAVWIDRREAIRYALKEGREGDLILLCGKGHETYQVLDGVTLFFDERVILSEALQKKCEEEQ